MLCQEDMSECIFHLGRTAVWSTLPFRVGGIGWYPNCGLNCSPGKFQCQCATWSLGWNGRPHLNMSGVLFLG